MSCKVADEDEAFSEESDIAPCKDRRRKYIIASHKIGIITNVVLFVRINSESGIQSQRRGYAVRAVRPVSHGRFRLPAQSPSSLPR